MERLYHWANTRGRRWSGLALRVGISSGADLEAVNRIIKAEKAGFDSAWVGDHFTHWSQERMFAETWSTLCIAGTHTSKILLGSGVTDPFRRNPALLAQSAATLDQYSKGRAIVGLGGGEKMNILPFGIEWTKPRARARETVILLRKLWKASVIDPVDYEGEFTTFRRAFIQIAPFRNRSIPIYIAGDSLGMRKLAGEIGDGWYAYIHSPSTFSEDLKAVLEATKKSGSDVASFETVAFLPCAVNTDSESAWDDVADTAATMLLLSGDKLERMGLRSKDLVPSSLRDAFENNDAEEIRKFQAMIKDVPRKAIEAVSAFGTPDECLQTVERFANAGAKHVVLSLRGKNLDASIDLMKRSVLPYLHDS